MHRSRDRSRSGGGSAFLAEAAAELNGFAPTHYWDFTQNKAIVAGAYIGAVTNSPGWSVTGGSLVMDATGLEATTQLIRATPTLTQEYTIYGEINRQADTGVAEYILQMFAAGTNRSYLYVSAGDEAAYTIRVGGVDVVAAVAGSAPVGSIYRVAARIKTNDSIMGNNGTLSAASGVVAMPTTPTQIQFASSTGGPTLGAGNRLLRAAFFTRLLSDAELDTLVTP